MLKLTGKITNYHWCDAVVDLGFGLFDAEGTLLKTNETLSKLGQAIDDGIDVPMEKFKRAERHWNHLQNNK